MGVLSVDSSIVGAYRGMLGAERGGRRWKEEFFTDKSRNSIVKIRASYLKMAPAGG